MIQGSFIDYQEMTQLMKSSEWLQWTKFLRGRINILKDKAISDIRNGKIVDAQKKVAVLDDVQKQVSLFIERRKELEKELDSNKEG